MRSILDALQEGRLIELPDIDKSKTLEYLALLIEAIPDIGNNSDLVKAVKEREELYNTGIGMGVACPHIRSEVVGELLCAVGWSPKGIDYGSPDNRKVHLVIMYYVPDSQRSLYLKEISGLAKAIKKTDEVQTLANIDDIQIIRNKLLDWIGTAIDEAGPDSIAKMIKLEARQATTTVIKPAILTNFIPFTCVLYDKNKNIILSQDPNIIEQFEKSGEITKFLNENADFELSGYKVVIRFSSIFANGRKLYECIALKLN